MSVRLLHTAVLLLIVFTFLPAPVGAADDPRYFSETRYRIDNDHFWNYFQRRGGIKTFGFPVSNTFPLLGFKVQIFQRQVMQLRPDGSVATLNLLDEGVMPYTRINNSTFPAADRSVMKQAPYVEDKDYHAKALQYVKDFAPDEWNGHKVNFYQTFMSTVSLQDAFPDGRGDANLLPGLNLEIWGLPTSKPTPDPTNGGFIYMRFQRGIMHYDASCGCTQGLLLGMYLKSIMTGRDLPSDLEEQAEESRYFEQYRRDGKDGVARPKELPGSDLSDAFLREAIVVVDAGHGAKEIGSSHTFADGQVLREKDLTLKVSQRLLQLLSDNGFAGVPTRTKDKAVNDPPRDLTADDKVTLADELQARVDLANRVGADLLLSVHFNGVANPEIRGTQMFYSGSRPFSERSKVFAELASGNMIKALDEAGYKTVDRKSSTDSSILGSDSSFYLLGPESKTIKRPSNMPAIIGEALYLTNADDANALRQERVLEAVARAYFETIKDYFKRFPIS